MKILFVRSGNNGDDPISTNQGISLLQKDIHVIYFDIIGKGLSGYLQNIFTCRNFIKICQPNIIHAHYSLCGFISSLTFSGISTGVSLMGSDVNNSGIFMKLLIKFFSRYIWSFTIVKSEVMHQKLKQTNTIIIPNGVNFDSFYEINKEVAQDELGWQKDTKHILFASDPLRPEKNYQLSQKALDLLKNEAVRFEVHILKNIDPEKLVLYYNAANLLLMTSLHEGSPNVIKEAMACNCPIVTTNVGDVKTILCDTKNVHITSYSPGEIKEKLLFTLLTEERTDGRSHISYLDSKLIAEKLIGLYKQTLNNA